MALPSTIVMICETSNYSRELPELGTQAKVGLSLVKTKAGLAGAKLEDGLSLEPPSTPDAPTKENFQESFDPIGRGASVEGRATTRSLIVTTNGVTGAS